MMKNHIRAVLFDLDGTVTDTERIYNEKWIEAARDMGLTDFGREEALQLRSLNHEDAARLLRERFGATVDFEGIRARCSALVDAVLEENGIPLKPGAHEILDFLTREGIRHAVVTATGLARATERLKRVGLYDKFDTVISAHQVARGKPYPDPYLYACQVFGEAPEHCLAVEDSPNGVLSAVRAGCQTVMVPDLTEPDEALSKIITASVPSLYALIDYMTRQT